MVNGKAACGINWSDDEDNNTQQTLEDCKGAEDKYLTKFILGRENEFFYMDGNGWKCRCRVSTQERNVDEKPSQIIILPSDVGDSVFSHKRRYFFHLFGWTYMLPLTSIVYSYASIAWVIWKSSHRVQRGVHMRNERIVVLNDVDEVTSFILYESHHMAHK